MINPICDECGRKMKVVRNMKKYKDMTLCPWCYQVNANLMPRYNCFRGELSEKISMTVMLTQIQKRELNDRMKAMFGKDHKRKRSMYLRYLIMRDLSDFKQLRKSKKKCKEVE